MSQKNKPVFEVWVADMEDKLLLATKEGQEGDITILADAEAWALDLSDNANVQYSFVIERKKIRTYKGKGLLIKQVQEEKNGDIATDPKKEDDAPPPSPTSDPEVG